MERPAAVIPLGQSRLAAVTLDEASASSKSGAAFIIELAVLTPDDRLVALEQFGGTVGIEWKAKGGKSRYAVYRVDANGQQTAIEDVRVDRGRLTFGIGDSGKYIAVPSAQR